ncbi:dynein regulatory complex protein 10-like [Euwallacea fornicatus]|uniref:dynein regulatory complex protein 10-like n=1 Tax=Euwallacea fornicatus TaxID=995702 RepID=UPI00338E566F
MASQKIIEKYMKKIPKPFNSIIENGDKSDYFQGLNIPKPEILSPMDMELRLQADRVMFSINKTVSILSVLAYLPYFLDNQARILKENFASTEISFIFHVLKFYESKDELKESKIGSPDVLERSVDMVNRINIGKTKHRSEDDKIIDGNLMQMINMIFTNKCIRQEINNAPSQMTIPYIVDFIRHFEELKEMARIKLYVTGTEEEAREKRLRQAYKSNIMLTAAIQDLEQQLYIQREQLGNELNKKMEIIDRYNKKIKRIKEDFQMNIEKNIHESEKKMMQECLESEEKQASLNVEAENITKQYQKLLEDDLDEEKQLRAKTMKTQIQLHNWLTKYDQEIGDKQEEFETLKAEYDTEKAAMDELQKKMDDQEHLYNTLMAEKEAEEERLFREMAYKMLINRSARIIQKAWKAYRERKKARKRGKKGKRGKVGRKSKG